MAVSSTPPFAPYRARLAAAQRRTALRTQVQREAQAEGPSRTERTDRMGPLRFLTAQALLTTADGEDAERDEGDADEDLERAEDGVRLPRPWFRKRARRDGAHRDQEQGADHPADQVRKRGPVPVVREQDEDRDQDGHGAHRSGDPEGNQRSQGLSHGSPVRKSDRRPSRRRPAHRQGWQVGCQKSGARFVRAHRESGHGRCTRLASRSRYARSWWVLTSTPPSNVPTRAPAHSRRDSGHRGVELPLDNVRICRDPLASTCR